MVLSYYDKEWDFEQIKNPWKIKYMAPFAVCKQTNSSHTYIIFGCILSKMVEYSL